MLKRFLGWDKRSLDNELFGQWRGRIKSFTLRSQPNITLRYIPVVDYLKKVPNDASIVEIGSGSSGITRFLNREVTGIDIVFDGPRTKHLRQVRGSAVNLPFQDNSFDCALSIDVIEHLDARARHTAVAEMLRVARNLVIIGFPCGPEAERWEAKVRAICQQKTMNGIRDDKKAAIARRSAFLADHFKNGLPTEAEILDAIYKLPPRTDVDYAVNIIARESVLVWYFLALSLIKFSLIRSLTTNAVAFSLLPLLMRLKWGGCYRKYIIVHKLGAPYRADPRSKRDAAGGLGIIGRGGVSDE